MLQNSRMSSLMNAFGTSEMRRGAEDRARMARLHLMNNGPLAAAVLDIARMARKVSGDAKDPKHMTAADELTHRVIPALALRLDPEVRLDQVEMAAIEAYVSNNPFNLETLSGDDLRRHAGGMIRHATTPGFMGNKSAYEESVRLLSRPLEEGNPAALLLDRIAPEPEGPVNRRSLTPMWRPDGEKQADAGFWLMANGPDSKPFPVAHYDDLDEAKKDLEEIEANGLNGNDIALKRISETGAVDGDALKFIVLTGRGEAISHTVEAILNRDDPELASEESRMSM